MVNVLHRFEGQGKIFKLKHPGINKKAERRKATFTHLNNFEKAKDDTEIRERTYKAAKNESSKHKELMHYK